MLVPGAEAAGPAAGHVHPADDGVLAADVPDEIDGAVEQDPPVVRVLALAEQLGAGLDPDLGTARDQVGELIVGQPAKHLEDTELTGMHQVTL